MTRTRILVLLGGLLFGVVLERVGEYLYASGWKQGVQDVVNAFQKQSESSRALGGAI